MIAATLDRMVDAEDLDDLVVGLDDLDDLKGSDGS